MSLIIELTPQEEARLAEKAQRRGVEPEKLAKKLLTDQLMSPDDEMAEGCLSLLDRFGHLFGTVEGLPPDLSTNPRYMEDFGRDSGEA